MPPLTLSHVQGLHLAPEARGQVLTLPVSRLDALLNDLVTRPETYLRLLDGQPADPPAPKHYEGHLFRFAHELDSNTAASRPGSVTNSTDETRHSGASPMAPEPDVAYVVTNCGDIRTIPAEHMRPHSALGADRLPSRLRSMYKRMISQKNWMAEASLPMFDLVGAVQANFIRTLDPLSLGPLPPSDLARCGDLPHHASTYFRLAQGRFVEINSTITITLPLGLLLTPEHDVPRYKWTKDISRILIAEYVDQSAWSDQEIADVVSPTLARRTVAKLRADFDIPDQHERKIVYRNGLGPFSMEMPLCALLRNARLTLLGQRSGGDPRRSE